MNLSRLLLPLLLALAGCSGGTPAKPQAAATVSPDKEGVTWTHAELLEYLRGKGLKFTQAGSGPGDEPAVMLVQSDGAEGEAADWVTIVLKKTAESARQNAGAIPGAFAWGRFLFLAESGTNSKLTPKARAILVSGH